MRKRQPNIELARVAACFIVVCLHTITWFRTTTVLIENSLLIRCFLFDGVPVFWFIMGYFLFAKPNVTLGSRLKKTFTQLLLPAFAVMVFSQIWQDWVLADVGKVSFLSCLDMHSFDFHNLFGNILKRSSGMTFGGHFWYIFTYLDIILWTPLLGFICVNEPRANKARRYLMLLAALFVINRDLGNIFSFSINGASYAVSFTQILSPSLLYVLIGYETFLHKDWLRQHARILKWIGLFGYIAACLAKFELSAHFMRVDPMDDHFIDINTVLGYITSYCLFIFIYSLNIRENSIGEKLSLHLGGKTLGIYLIHGCVFRKLSAVGVREFFYTKYTANPDNLVIEIVCSILYALFVFLVAYIIVLILQTTKRFIKHMFGRLKACRRPVLSE